MSVRAVIGALVLGSCALPQAPATASQEFGSYALRVARGGEFAQAQCSSCHAVGLSGSSPLAAAPPLRQIGQRYPVSDLSEAFAEGVVTGHPAMPRFVLSSDENADLIAYLTSIQAAPAPPESLKH